MKVEERVTSVFRDIFDNPDLKITPSTSAQDIEDWDSLANINLIVAMEKEFNVRFQMQDIQRLTNVGGMIELINRSIQKS